MEYLKSPRFHGLVAQESHYSDRMLKLEHNRANISLVCMGDAMLHLHPYIERLYSRSETNAVTEIMI